MLRADLKTEFDALLPGRSTEAGATRRTALRTALGVGYAAAAMPLMAQTSIRTSSEGLTTGEITIDVNGFKMPAYRAAPAGRSNLPVILVIHEVFGVHEYIADTARRFARAGYLAIAPELFARQGDPQSYNELARMMDEVVSQVPDAQVMGDLDAAVQWAGANGGDAQKVGITGFCWGGRIVWLYAAHSKVVKAAVSWYGRLAGEGTALTPTNPMDIATRLNAPVLGLYGGDDPGIPLATVNHMKDLLATGTQASKQSRFIVYPDAPHAFHADYRSSYQEASAIDGFRQALAWFNSNR